MRLLKLVARYDNVDSLVSRIRKKRARLFLNMLEALLAKSETVTILDIGGTLLTHAMFKDIFPDSFITKERFLLLNKSFIASNHESLAG